MIKVEVTTIFPKAITALNLSLISLRQCHVSVSSNLVAELQARQPLMGLEVSYQMEHQQYVHACWCSIVQQIFINLNCFCISSFASSYTSTFGFIVLLVPCLYASVGSSSSTWFFEWNLPHNTMFNGWPCKHSHSELLYFLIYHRCFHCSGLLYSLTGHCLISCSCYKYPPPPYSFPFKPFFSFLFNSSVDSQQPLCVYFFQHASVCLSPMSITMEQYSSI